jgi:hypothetical protein
MTESPEVSAVTVDAIICEQCGALDAGPRTLCPVCHGENLALRQVSGDGALLAWTVIRRPPVRFNNEDYYSVALVGLDAGIQVTGRLVIDEDALEIGDRVRAVASPSTDYSLFERIHP